MGRMQGPADRQYAPFDAAASGNSASSSMQLIRDDGDDDGGEDSILYVGGSYAGALRTGARYAVLSRTGGPKSLEHFKKDHLRLKGQVDAASKTNAVAVTPRETKILFGILTIAFEKEYRDVHRSSWTTEPGACSVVVAQPHSEQGRECRFFYTFAVGHNDDNEEAVQEERKAHHDMSKMVFDDKDGNMTVSFDCTALAEAATWTHDVRSKE